ncbi:MAG: hypothetical protein JW976_12075 [Syntrophaceae bacterium]|nr:hypothetical protein [Syntrophaceae bacterium]
MSSIKRDINGPLIFNFGLWFPFYALPNHENDAPVSGIIYILYSSILGTLKMKYSLAFLLALLLLAACTPAAVSLTSTPAPLPTNTSLPSVSRIIVTIS